MHLLILGCLAGAAALRREPQAASAQRADPYPWCSIDSRGGAGRLRGLKSYIYDNRDQFMATMSGIGGIWVQNPAYRPAAAVQPIGKARAGAYTQVRAARFGSENQ
jgi:hypothetical protein